MVVTELRWVILSRNSPPRQRSLVTSGYTPFTTKHTQCKRVLTITATPSPTAPHEPPVSHISLPGHLGRASAGERTRQRHGLGCSRTLLRPKRETRSMRVEASVHGAPRAESSLRPMAVAEILPAVRLPAPQREQGQQVFPRLPLWSSQPRGAQENKDTGGKGESGRGERPAWAVLSESAGWPRPFARGAGVAQPL